jgi:hypothetical protein
MNKGYNKLILNPPNIHVRKLSIKDFPKIINIPDTESEVKCTVKILKNKSSNGYDIIFNKIIKAVCDHFSKPLTYILSMSHTRNIPRLTEVLHHKTTL